MVAILQIFSDPFLAFSNDSRCCRLNAFKRAVAAREIQNQRGGKVNTCRIATMRQKLTFLRQKLTFANGCPELAVGLLKSKTIPRMILDNHRGKPF